MTSEKSKSCTAIRNIKPQPQTHSWQSREPTAANISSSQLPLPWSSSPTFWSFFSCDSDDDIKRASVGVGAYWRGLRARAMALHAIRLAGAAICVFVGTCHDTCLQTRKYATLLLFYSLGTVFSTLMNFTRSALGTTFAISLYIL